MERPGRKARAVSRFAEERAVRKQWRFGASTVALAGSGRRAIDSVRELAGAIVATYGEGRAAGTAAGPVLLTGISTLTFVRRHSDTPFFLLMGGLGGFYIVLVVLLLLADVAYMKSPDQFRQALAKPEIQYAIQLTLISCTVAAILSVWIGTPLAYLMSRFKFPGRALIDTIVDIPIVLPPLVLGLSLLILFHLPIGGNADSAGWRLEEWLRDDVGFPVTYRVPAVVLAQFSVACAFAVRTMRVAFDQINPRAEDVARTLGCSRGGAFLYVALPQAGRGLVAAFTIAWARSLGEFGPILVFAGATRMRTEVLSTTVFLELSIGNLGAAVAVSLLMVLMAMIVLMVLRLLGTELKS